RQISTKNYSYFKINQICINELGSLSCDLINYYNKKENKNKVLFSFKISCIDSKIKVGNDLLIELINNQNFSDEQRLYSRLQEIKNNNLLSISDKGHSVALVRAYSFIDKGFYDKDIMNGIGYLDFINNLCDNFKTLKDDIIKRLYNVKNMISISNLIVHMTGDLNSFNNCFKYVNEFKAHIGNTSIYNQMEFVPNPHVEAIKAPYNVNYCAKVGIYNDEFNSSSRVLENALSKDYLWLNVRVHGGAYGVMLNVGNNNLLGFTSYRDPNIDSTLKAYDDIVDYIKDFNPNDDELLKYKIGALSNLQMVLHVKNKGNLALKLFLSGRSYEDRCSDLENIINATNEDLVKQLSYYKDALKTNSICVLGNKEKIDKSNIKFDVKRNLTN
ncbi:MAG: hypothetical protein K6E20_04610, partial [Acholeplasmatales bacterium]|nr:hypothetical protein [Acholeplasmatales bacterium]